MNQQGPVGRNGFQNTGNGFAGDIAIEVQNLPVDGGVDVAAEFDDQSRVAGRQDAGQDIGQGGGHQSAGESRRWASVV